MSKFFFRSILVCFIPLIASAETQSGIGQIAENIMVPVNIVTQLASGASIAVGITFLFACLIRYFEYRRNPLAHPLGTVLTLLIIGLVLLGLPFVYRLAESGAASGL